MMSFRPNFLLRYPPKNAPITRPIIWVDINTLVYHDLSQMRFHSEIRVDGTRRNLIPWQLCTISHFKLLLNVALSRVMLLRPREVSPYAWFIYTPLDKAFSFSKKKLNYFKRYFQVCLYTTKMKSVFWPLSSTILCKSCHGLEKKMHKIWRMYNLKPSMGTSAQTAEYKYK